MKCENRIVLILRVLNTAVHTDERRQKMESFKFYYGLSHLYEQLYKYKYYASALLQIKTKNLYKPFFSLLGLDRGVRGEVLPYRDTGTRIELWTLDPLDPAE